MCHEVQKESSGQGHAFGHGLLKEQRNLGEEEACVISTCGAIALSPLQREVELDDRYGGRYPWVGKQEPQSLELETGGTRLFAWDYHAKQIRLARK